MKLNQPRLYPHGTYSAGIEKIAADYGLPLLKLHGTVRRAARVHRKLSSTGAYDKALQELLDRLWGFWSRLPREELLTEFPNQDAAFQSFLWDLVSLLDQATAWRLDDALEDLSRDLGARPDLSGEGQK